MFTGIIKSVGTVEEVSKNLLKIKHDLEVTPGDSIAINGVCLTVNDDGAFDVMDETLKCSNLGELQVEGKVNLEPALEFNGKLDGHLVVGHVDFVGEVLESGSTLKITFPTEYSKYFAMKGSVTINGVSLTISGLSEDWLEVSLVDFTLKNTNLGELKAGDKVNIEVDLIARYVERMLEGREGQTKFEWLKERNFI